MPKQDEEEVGLGMRLTLCIYYPFMWADLMLCLFWSLVILSLTQIWSNLLNMFSVWFLNPYIPTWSKIHTIDLTIVTCRQADYRCKMICMHAWSNPCNGWLCDLHFLFSEILIVYALHMVFFLLIKPSVHRSVSPSCFHGHETLRKSVIVTPHRCSEDCQCYCGWKMIWAKPSSDCLCLITKWLTTDMHCSLLPW